MKFLFLERSFLEYILPISKVILKVLELELTCPLDVSLQELRPWIVSHLSEYGDPLRWAITSIEFSAASDLSRELWVEAVVIIS